jgi:tRNA (guanine-N7-)-methyltransferase
MKRRIRQHVNPLKLSALRSCGGPLPIPGGLPVEVDLGCGDGHFLLELARRDPTGLYIGLDIRDRVIARARSASRLEGLANLWFVTSNMIVDGVSLFPPYRVRRFHISFPDPYFKSRQRNRRWLSTEIVEALAISLEAGGEICFQSDHFPSALEALSLLEAESRLVNVVGEWSFSRLPTGSVPTTRELLCTSQERPIWRLRFARGNA